MENRGRFKKGESANPETQFKKGSAPWNKGLKYFSSTKGKPRHPNSGYQKGHKNYHKKGNVWKMDSRIKFSSTQQGIEVSEWKGFKSELNHRLRNSSKWKIWRELVFLRDDFICQNKDCEFCGNKLGFLIHPHHIKQRKDYPELVFKIDNGITYCAEFHLKSNLHKKINQLNKEGGK